MTALRVVVGGSDSEAFARILEHRHALEPAAREGLLEPELDLARELERPFVRAVVALEGDAVLGFLLGWYVADEVHVLDVLVLPAARRRGVGAALLGAVLDDARAREARVALLEVRRSNAAAIALYRCAGFVAVNVRRGYYDRDGEDAVEMACGLVPGAIEAFGEPIALE